MFRIIQVDDTCVYSYNRAKIGKERKVEEKKEVSTTDVSIKVPQQPPYG